MRRRDPPKVSPAAWKTGKLSETLGGIDVEEDRSFGQDSPDLRWQSVPEGKVRVKVIGVVPEAGK